MRWRCSVGPQKRLMVRDTASIAVARAALRDGDEIAALDAVLAVWRTTRAPERSRLDLDRGRGSAPEEAPGDETAQRRSHRASRLGWLGGSTPPGERVEERVVTLSLAKPAERERRQSRVQCDLVRIICPHSRPPPRRPEGRVSIQDLP